MNLLIKPVSGTCNMACTYCFYADEQEKRSTANAGVMTEETLSNIMRKMLAKAQGSCNIAFQGGEPTLAGLEFYKKVIWNVRYYNHKRLPVTYALQTNGYALNEEWCRFFKEHGFLIGLSIDGTEEIHNTYRKGKDGSPTFSRVKQSAALLERFGVPYNILTVVNKEVAKHPKEIYAFYKKQGWKYQQYVACLDPLYEIPGNQEYSLLPQEYGQFLIDLFQCWFQDLKQNRQPYIRQFENYIGILLGIQPEACEQRGTCGIQYAIEADGTVYPCDFYMLDEYKLGNINENSVSAIDRRRVEIVFLKSSEETVAACRSCTYFPICRGGCSRNRSLNEQGVYMNYFCPGYQMFLKECLLDMLQIAQAMRQG